jgi:acyl-CoA synthetase (AMP-forming)/AMP-acid ligase II
VLIELVRQAAQQAPEQPAIISSYGVASYGECLARSEVAASGLARLGVKRFGCALDAPADILAAIAGSSAVASESCLYPPNLDARGLSAVASRFGHDVVVTDRDQPLDGPRVVTFRELQLVDERPLPQPDHAPVLILTTGTTGEQKGARHDWSRLVQAVRHRDRDEQPGVRWLLAYNLNQFAGVQMLVHALASRATLVAPSSRRADDVIEAIRTHAVTHVSATPTFWRLLAGRLDDGSAAELRLRQITLGGEAAPQGLIEQLQHLFPDARVSHVYAGTEFGSVVSVNDGRSGLPRSVLDRDANADVQLRIVAGELQIRSRVGMLGYHQREDDHGEWRATGDLVEVRPDRIHFVGRTSEIINVGGAKVHPLPVEELVCSVVGVQLAAVYGEPNPVTGQIVAVDVVASLDADISELPARIHEKSRQLPAAGRPRRIRVVPELEMRGNKLLRHEPPAGA